MNRNNIGFVTVVALLLIASFFSLNLFFKQKTEHDTLNVKTFPYQVKGWTGRDLKITEKAYKILETRNLFSREYANVNGEKIHLFIIYSETNRRVFHPPEVCFLGSGINIVNKDSESIKVGGKTFQTNRMFLEKGDRRDLAFYFYKVGDLYTDNYLLQQAVFAFNQMLGRNRGGATVRVTMPITKNEDETLLILKNFMKDVVSELEKLTG